MPTISLSGESCNGSAVPTKSATIPTNPTAAQIEAALDSVCEQVADELDRLGCPTKAQAYRDAIQ